jgi:hypothetical protein
MRLSDCRIVATYRRYKFATSVERVLDCYKEGRWVNYRLDYSNHCCDLVMAWLEKQLYQTEIVKDDQLALKEIMSVDRVRRPKLWKKLSLANTERNWAKHKSNSQACWERR